MGGIAQLRMNALAQNVSPVKTCILSNPGVTPGEVDCDMTEQVYVCLICDKAGGKNLRKAATLVIGAKMRRCASIKILLRKLFSGDMIAIEAAYDLNCPITKLHRDAANIVCRL